MMTGRCAICGEPFHHGRQMSYHPAHTELELAVVRERVARAARPLVMLSLAYLLVESTDGGRQGQVG